MPMNVIADNRNRDSDSPGRLVRVSGVHQEEGVYSGDVSGSGTFIVADERQFRAEATLSSGAEAELLLMHGFQAGDMVWAKVKSHPWWPGYIFQESFCPSVHRTRKEGYVLVAFFGDNSYGWFDPAELLPFGPHFADKSLQSTSKNFVDAVKDAIDEISRRGALGLSCCCQNPGNFRKTSIPGYSVVDVLGYDSAVYSESVVDKARENFVPGEAMSFVRKLAVGPCEVNLQDVDAVKMVAILEAIRKSEYYRLIGKSVKFTGPVPTRQQSDAQGILQRPTLREPRGEPEVPSGHRRKKAAAAAPDDNRRPNQYLLKRRVDAPVPHSPAGASPTSSPRLEGLPAPKALVPSSTAVDQPFPQNDAGPLELPDAAPPVARCRFDDETGAPESAPLKPEQEQPQRRGSSGWNLSPAVGGQLRPQNRHERAHPDSSAKKKVALKMKRPRENGRTPSSALGSWKDDMEDETEGEMMVSDYARPGTGGKTLVQKKAARMSVGLRPYPAEATALEKVPKVVCGIVGEKQPAGFALVSRTLPAVPTPEQEDSQREPSALVGLLADLKALALNPYHGESDGIPDAVSRSILLFRSRVTGRSISRKQSSPPGEPNVSTAAKATKRPFNSAKEQKVREAIRVATAAVSQEPQPLSPPLVSEEPKMGFDEDLGKKRGVSERAEPKGVQMGVKKLKTKQRVNYAAKPGLLDGISSATVAEVKETQPFSAPVSEELKKGFDDELGEKLGVWERGEGQEMGVKKLKRKHLVNYAAKPKEAQSLLASVTEEPKRDFVDGIRKKSAARELADDQEEMRVAKMLKKTKPPVDEASEQEGFRDDFYSTPVPPKAPHTPLSAPVAEEPRINFENSVGGNKRPAWERVEMLEDKVAAKKAKIVAQMKALAAARKHQAPPESRTACVPLDDTPPPQLLPMSVKSLPEEKKTAPPKSSPTPRELKIAAALAAAMKAEAPITEATKPERRVRPMKAEGPVEMMKQERRVQLMKSGDAKEVTKTARLVPAMKAGGPKPARLLPVTKEGGPTETTKPVRFGGPTEMTTKKPPRFVAPAQQVETQPRPTYLVLRFPPGSTLPSVPSLKARLARFGSLDPSGCRVTWRTRTCQVLFRRRADAARACRHISSAEGTGRMFGPVKLACGLVEANPPPPTPPAKLACDGGMVEEANGAPPGFEDVTPPPSQLKSCLKQPKASLPPPPSPSPGQDELQRGSGGGVRMKFVLKEEDDNVQKLCTRLGNGYGKVDAAAATPTPWDAWEEVQVGRETDVSDQMMKLLWKCHGVVDGMRDARGYLPYHTLD